MGSNKISTIAASEDGNRIYCLFKQDNKTIAKGYYDFEKESFFITEFYTKKLPEGETPKQAIETFKHLLDLDFDWNLKDADKLIEAIEEGELKTKKRKRKNKNEQRGTHATYTQ